MVGQPGAFCIHGNLRLPLECKALFRDHAGQ